MAFSAKNALMTATVVSLIAMTGSCVNEDYDLTKGLDKTISINGDFSAPIGNTNQILIGDLLKIDDDDSELISKDANGNYSLLFPVSSTETSFSVPLVSISKDLVNDGGHIASIDRNSLLTDMGIVSTNVPIPSGLTATKHIDSSSTEISIDESVPEEITGVRDVTGNAIGTISFKTNVGKATVSGLSIDFPDYLNLQVSSGDQNISYSFDDKNNVITFAPIEISKTQSIVNIEITSIDFTKMPSGQGFIADSHRISVNDKIEISDADVKILSDDLGTSYNDIPEKIKVDISLKISSVDVSSATIKVNPDIDVNPETITIGSYPDFIDGNTTVLDIYDPQIRLNVNNDSPVTLMLDADIESGNSSDKNSVHIGSKDRATDEITIEAKKETKIFISRTGKEVPSGYTGITVTNLSDLMEDLPDEIAFKNVDVNAKDEYITVVNGMNYSFKCTYNVVIPLAFGKQVKFKYHHDFKGWNKAFNSESKTEYDVEYADIVFDFVNTLPLGFSIETSAIDTCKNVIPEIAMNLSGTVAAGSIESPSIAPMKLTLKGSSENMKKLDGLRLHLNASGSDNECEGICLNEKQGIKLENIKIHLQGSITTEL